MENRVIKFRALKDDVSNSVWKYGQLVYDAIGCPRITEIDSSGEGLTFHTCIKGTECQFTGLKDKQGKEIYEGDIMKWDSDEQENGYVVYEANGCQFRIAFKSEHSTSCHIGLNIAGRGTAIVIGNIFQSPELINPINE